ncbi:MAG: PAS domain S-box protein [Gemmatimonadales bacterium]
MSESPGLKADHHPPAAPGPDGARGAVPDEVTGPDRGRERAALYLVIFTLLVGGSILLRRNFVWDTGASTHTILEAISTLLAFIIGGLALVRYYSRKRITFLFIGCGFLGAGVLGLNHTLTTEARYVAARIAIDPSLRPGDLDAWTWTAERVFLSLFLFVSLLAWRQQVREEGREEGRVETLPEAWVYGNALLMTLVCLLFFEWVPLGTLTFPFRAISRPAELLPASFFALAFFGFLKKGSWRHDSFEHWLLVSLLISALAHGSFMAFSEQRYDAMFDAAHLLKVASYAAILAGLMSSVYETFRREAEMLEVITANNAQLAHEIEVRAHTEQAAKESRARLQEFLDNANDVIQSVGADGRFLYVNSSWKRVLGYGDEQLERLKLTDIVHPAQRSKLERELQRILDGGRPTRFDVDFVAADGRVVMLSGSMQAQQVGGRTVSAQSIFRDVTEQRLAQRELDASRRNLTALVENTGDSIWSVDREHRLITLNSAFALAVEARTGSEPVVGQLPAQVFPPEDVAWYEELYDRALSGERHIALRTDDVDGQLRHFELYANPIHSLEGVSGVVIFGKDITARVRAEEALVVAKNEAEAANKAKSDFLANMSHELRTPLNSVIGFTNILLKNKDARLTDKDLGFLQRVLSNGKHLLALINEVLDLAKVEAGRMELIIEEVDLSKLCVETVQQLEGQAKTKEGAIVLRSEVPDVVATVKTDSAKLKQVIINLVGNALKFTEQGSVTVRLDLAPDGHTPVAISVVDTGIGIPADRLEAIFEAFQQADAGTSRKYGGTGLGLTLSRSICQLMGYDLIVESEPGKGSTFKIVMGERAARPVKEEETDTRGETTRVAAAPAAGNGAAGSHPARKTTGAPQASGERQSMRDLKVLVVDDEKDSRLLIAHYLEEFGCSVVTAAGGEQGIQLAREQAPDLITLDLMMPGMTGWEVLKALKADAELRRIPVVIVSVLANEGKGSLLGAVDFITKPFEREDLLRVLWRRLGRTRGSRLLLVIDDERIGTELADFLQGRGLEAIVPADGVGALEAIDTHAPDAVILELAPHGRVTLEMLTRIRENRLYTGLPTFVLTDADLSTAARDELQDLMTIVVPRSEPVAALEELLGVLFPIEEPAERRA